jgi:hypothetical protein
MMATALNVQEPPIVVPRWSPLQRAAFRFVCCYELLYAMPSQGRASIVYAVPGAGLLMQPWVAMWRAICPWIGVHWFGLSGQSVAYTPTGSGDTTLAYIENFLFLVVALVAAMIWSVADRRRPNYQTLHAWLRLLVRYTLAFTLFTYGFVKVVPLQFPALRLTKLIEPYGEFSPMGVLWSFMSASPAYTIFSGAAEVVGGLLLLFRRTTMLGALVSFGVLVNVVALNFCYDVPVKLYSTNLLLMAVFLIAPDLRRLMNVFLFNRAVEPADAMAVRFERRPLRIAAIVIWILFAGVGLFGRITAAWIGYQNTYVKAKHPPIYGVYYVGEFELNGHTLDRVVDTVRWRQAAFQDDSLAVRMMDGQTAVYRGAYMPADNRFSGGNAAELSWSKEGEALIVKGRVGPNHVSARLWKADTPLLERGFHWIQEYPFNR